MGVDVDTGIVGVSRVDRAELRRFISEKYAEVATNPELDLALVRASCHIRDIGFYGDGGVAH